MSSKHYAGVHGRGQVIPIISATLAIAVGVSAVSASAQDSVWIGGSGFVWNTVANWESGLVPNASRDAFVNNGGTANITFTGAAQAKSLHLGVSAGQSGTVQVFVGNSLTTGMDIFVGQGGEGTFAVSGGGDVTSRSAVIGLEANSIGTATVAGIGSTWINTNASGGGGGLGVGGDGTGILTIESGGTVSSVQGSIAGGTGGTGTGTVTVRGAGSAWNNSEAVRVGWVGNGTLNVEDQGAVNSGSGTSIADFVGSIGNVTVTGPGSNWTIYGGLPIGINGSGTLTISDSGIVDVRDFSIFPGPVSINALSSLNFGAGGTAGVLMSNGITNNGLIYFDHTNEMTITAPLSGNGRIQKFTGAGDTTFANVSAFTGSFLVGGSRAIVRGIANGSDYDSSEGGTLYFDGGTVNLNLASIRASAATGVVEYDGATIHGGFLRGAGTHRIVPGASPTRFNAVSTFNSTTIVQDGPASLVNFTNGGTLNNNATLSISGGINASTGVLYVNRTVYTADFGNNGVIAIDNGGVLSNHMGDFINGGGSRTTINSGGTIDLLAGTDMNLNGALLVNNGTLNGTVNVNYGSLAMGTGSFDVVNVGTGGVYAPGNSPGISTAAAVNFDSAPVASGAPMLAIELGGTTPGTQYDQLHVTGSLSLGGALAVSLIDGFTPIGGNSFDILDWGSLSGTFSSIQLPTADGSLTWDTSQLYTTGVLSVMGPAGLLGDYNQDGTVNAADYVVWRNNMGSPTSLANDNTPGVGQDDYDRWVDNFGQSLTNPSSASATASAGVAVPEASSLLLLVLAAPLLSLRGRRLDSFHTACRGQE